MSQSSFSSESGVVSGVGVAVDNEGFARLSRGPTELRAFLRTAVRVTSALAELHGREIVHRNIRPANVLVHSETAEVRLLGVKDSYSVKEANASESLPYTSPEQTEGMNRPVDHRADLYSLGVVLYELLTGELPFRAEDPIGWVQAHLMKSPRDPREIIQSTPSVLAEILLRLLNKTVEERYQSARGLLLDLETCLVELEAKGKVEPFPLGARDVWHGLRISARLYGREKESADLIAAFERLLASGTPEIALVSGYSGVGKSSLVQEMHKPIVRERGLFLAGKFDQHKRNIPYITISQAFREMVHHILGESEAQILNWKERITEALGQNAQLIIDVIPQVEQIIGKQPPVAPLPISDAQNRFNNVFRSFIGVFCAKEHPLTLFLDDLQYADFASLKLIRHLLANSDTRYFFVLGAYRDNEVDASHPFMMTLEDMRKDKVHITSLVLKPLEVEHLTQLVADTFHCDSERAGPLARLLHEKTGGNPFFANQFLAELHHENLVLFNVDKALWHWNIAEIEAKEFTDDVVELMASKLRRLPGETQAALQLAACIGNEFEVEMLEITHDKTPEETYEDLDHAVRAEFMLRKGNIYKFLHDRVHQAAYSLIPEEQRSWVHLRIGRLLLERTPSTDLDERSFDIVNQFNIGHIYITEQEEKYSIARLNLTAGRKAKASVAYQSAIVYLKAGLSLLEDESWEAIYADTYALHLELAECEYLTGNFGESERLTGIIAARAKSVPEQSAAYRLRVQLYMAQANNVKAIEVGLEGIKLLGMDVPKSPDQAAVGGEFFAVRGKMQGREIEDLLRAPEASDPIQIALMDLIDVVGVPAYYSDQNLFMFLMCRLVGLSIEHGNTGASAFGYVTFGSALGLIFGDNKDAYRYGKLAYDLSEKHKFAAYKSPVCNVFASMITIWSHHVRMHVEYSRIGFRAGIECGNILYSSFNRAQLILGRLVRGDCLDEVYSDSEIALAYIRSAKIMFMADGVVGIQCFIQNMRGLTNGFSTFDREGFSEETHEAYLEKCMPLVQFWYHLATIQARFFSGDYAKALVAYEKSKEQLWAVLGLLLIPEFFFYSALAAASHYAEVSEAQQIEYKALISASEAKLRGWAAGCPDNFAGNHLLVAAELARIEERRDEAATLYQQAIEAQKASGFVHCEGICNELAARFYLKDAPQKAAEHLREARTCYKRWGADGKVKQLEETFAQILS